jgi:hypothetical protein
MPSADERDVLSRLLSRRPIPAAKHELALAWLRRSRTLLGRVTGPEVIATLFAALLVAYVLTGQLVVLIVALVLIPAFVVSLALWGGVRAWSRSGRQPPPPLVRPVRRVAVPTTPTAARPPIDWTDVAVPAAALAAMWVVPEVVLRVSRVVRRRRGTSAASR